MAAAATFLCLSLLSGALGLRLARNESEDANESEGTEMYSASRSDFVPALEEFTHIWTARYSSEKHLGEPMPSSIQLILGVMTVPQEGPYREVVRQTWLRQAGVCYWKLQRQENCSVYVAFVIGKNGTGGRTVSAANVSDEELRSSHQEPGMLVLDTVENMDRGKSGVWFSTALNMFPWATHIAKSDMDTYPFLHKLLYRMNQYRNCTSQMDPYEYMGTIWGRWLGLYFNNSCPSSKCGAFNFGPTFGYMQGGFYILSRPLVEKINWNIRLGPEDQVIGEAVDLAAAQQNFCVVIRRPDAWFHNNARISSHFANQFEV
mmetsp:Transcript_94648/g.229901  ORF Transcript_94648/g.229901 Transcript_94648/m.229901 type:complete len:318 (+) Transcript_94648:71-1024(+)